MRGFFLRYFCVEAISCAFYAIHSAGTVVYKHMAFPFEDDLAAGVGAEDGVNVFLLAKGLELSLPVFVCQSRLVIVPAGDGFFVSVDYKKS